MTTLKSKFLAYIQFYFKCNYHSGRPLHVFELVLLSSHFHLLFLVTDFYITYDKVVTSDFLLFVTHNCFSSDHFGNFPELHVLLRSFSMYTIFISRAINRRQILLVLNKRTNESEKYNSKINLLI